MIDICGATMSIDMSWTVWTRLNIWRSVYGNYVYEFLHLENHLFSALSLIYGYYGNAWRLGRPAISCIVPTQYTSYRSLLCTLWWSFISLVTIILSYHYESIVNIIITISLTYLSVPFLDIMPMKWVQFQIETQKLVVCSWPVIFININKAKNIHHKFIFKDTLFGVKW